MKHITWGAVALLGVVSLAGCYSYASDAINNHNFNTVQATPVFSVVKVGDSDQVVVRLVNDFNNGTNTSYTVTNVGTGIAVHYLSTYRPLFDPKTDSLVPTGDKNAQVYYIVGQALGRYSFTITPTSVNTGVSTTVNVLVQPKTLFTALSKHTAAPGDTVTITAPAGLLFGQKATVTFGSGSPVTIVSRAADSTSITFIVGSGLNGPAAVSVVYQPTASNVPAVALSTSDSLVTPTAPNPIPVTVSATSLTLGQKLTITLGGGLRFLRNSTISIGQLATTISSISADSLTAIVTPTPGSNDSLNFTNLAFQNYHPTPSGVGADTISAGAVGGKGDKVIQTQAAPIVAPTTLSATTAVAGTTVTATLGGSLRFTKASHVLVGGFDAPITTFSADSLTATFVAPVPAIGASRAISYTSVVTIAAPTVLFTLNSDSKVLTVTASAASDANATTPATASTITPAATGLYVVVDGGPFTAGGACTAANFGGGLIGCRFYKVVTTAAGTFTGTLTWSTGTSTDLGLYLLPASLTGGIAIADNLGAQSGGPETGTSTSVPAGTYYLVVANYGPATPANIQFIVKQP
jgi:hypothetical protein